ncbi:MAG: riboflavin biosynthesis protein RibF [Opitutales bacterium]|nr:riboflavin biosynthesis protein RibF [Opitutales bacterium]
MSKIVTLQNAARAFPDRERPVHLALGVFDGAHRGHRAIFQAAVAGARKANGVPAVLTFDPHPQVLFAGTGAVKLIYPLEQRFQIFEDCGFEKIVCEPFTREFAAIPAQDFLSYLKKKIPSLAAVYCGENFHFGSRRAGNTKDLPVLAMRSGIDSTAVPAVKWEGAPVSSTRIRAALESGQIEAANAMLSEDYFMTGTVIGGNRLGRTIGFPTLNVPWTPETRVPFGAYAVRLVDLETGTDFEGVANYGVRPTIGDLKTMAPLLESHLLVPAGTPVPGYGAKVRVSLISFLRPEQKFLSLEALKSQLEQDKTAALQKFLEKNKT